MARTNPRPVVTAARAARLVRLLKLIAAARYTRPQLMRKLGLDLRAFYRDLKAVRAFRIVVTVNAGVYRTEATLDKILDLLPFPDPHLSLGQAMQLANGRSAAHHALRKKVAAITGR